MVPIGLSILFQTAAIACGKQAAVTLPRFTAQHIVRDGYYIGSLAFLGLQALAWQLTLSRFPLSVAYAAMSIVYVNVLLLSAFVFGERVSSGNVGGAALIIAGVIAMTGVRRAQAID